MNYYNSKAAENGRKQPAFIRLIAIFKHFARKCRQTDTEMRAL